MTAHERAEIVVREMIQRPVDAASVDEWVRELVNRVGEIYQDELYYRYRKG